MDVFAYSNNGGFTNDKIPDFTGQGKVAIVTGGNIGIGLETIRQLASHGIKVYMASRNEEKARDAIASLKSDSEKPIDVEFIKIDLNDLADAQRAAEEYKKKESRLDILVCNAGIMAYPYELTKDGIEQQFQVNHLSHFSFVKHLLPVLESTGKANGHPSRVVFLSSIAHRFISFNPFLSPDFSSKEAVNRKLGFTPLMAKWMRYSQSKLANLLTAREINERYPNAEVRAAAVHPGMVSTDLYNNTFWASSVVSSVTKKYFVTPPDGALATLYCATSPEIEENNTWDRYLGTFGLPHVEASYAKDSKLRKDLWKLSEELLAEAAQAPKSNL